MRRSLNAGAQYDWPFVCVQVVFDSVLAEKCGLARALRRAAQAGDLVPGQVHVRRHADHPRVLVDLPKLKIQSTAAGRYQLLRRYYDAYKKTLGLKDFAPLSQDLIAPQQIRERRALPLIQAGKIPEAIGRVRNIWASLPGAGYGQHEHAPADLLAVYRKAGGTVAP